jgi:hypothetical protein
VSPKEKPKAPTTQSNNPNGRPALDVTGTLNRKIRAELKGKDEQQLLIILNFIKGGNK